MEKAGYVYIMASGFKHLYIGVTSNLERRVWQHKNGTYAAAFTERYNIKQLVYLEQFGSMPTAIAREKQLKRWSRVKKIGLIVAANPTWRDLSLDSGQAIKPFSGELEQLRCFGAEYRGLSTTQDDKPSCFGRDDTSLQVKDS